MLSFLVHVNLDDVQAEWINTIASKHIHDVAQYYNIYEDLFGEAYFHPVIPLKIEFEYEKDPSVFTPVYRGNLIKPAEVIVQHGKYLI